MKKDTKIPGLLLVCQSRRHSSKRCSKGGGVGDGEQILVTVSQQLTVEHGRNIECKLGALLEGTAA